MVDVNGQGTSRQICVSLAYAPWCLRNSTKSRVKTLSEVANCADPNQTEEMSDLGLH